MRGAWHRVFLCGAFACGAPASPPQLSNVSLAPATRTATLGAFAATIPQSWKPSPITSDTQVAWFIVPQHASLIVYSGGEYEVSGIDWFARWRDGFMPDLPREIEVVAGAKLKTRVMRVTGSYFDPDTRTVHPHHAMIVALVESQHDRYYFKLLGPRSDVAAHELAFRAMLASLSPY